MKTRPLRSGFVLSGVILIGLLLVAPSSSSATPVPARPTIEVGGPAVPTPLESSRTQQTPVATIDLTRLHPALRRALEAGNCLGPVSEPEVALARPTKPVEAATSSGAESQGESGSECSGEGYIPVVIEWKPLPGFRVEAPAGASRLEHRQQVVAELQTEAHSSSAALVTTLEEAVGAGQARNVRSFWASPTIALEARPGLIRTLAQRPDVVQVRLDEPIYLEQVPFHAVTSADLAGSLRWNLRMLDLDLAKQALGLDGTGVVVANLDTGVDWQHPALLKKYRGYRERGVAVHWGNWHVSTGEPYLYPGDGQGHGTHTMGTIVGDDGTGDQLGVAPGARWIAVKVFNNAGVTYESWIHDAFQWILAPEGDPALAPDVVSNSWGSAVSSDDRFRGDLASLRAAGILPIFSAGNEGPDAATVTSPASLPDALAVGAVDDESLPAYFSGRGPSPWGEVKPEVTAPGVNIISSFPGGGLASGTGTSMAAPHVAGLAALLLQANPDLTPDELENLIERTSRPLGTGVPNNTTGWGLVNAYAAGLRVTASGEIEGRVLRLDGGSIANPEIRAALRDGSQQVTVLGDSRGAFTLALRPGLYDVTGRAFGFDAATQSGVEVRAGAQTSITLSLVAQPAGSFFGRVTDLQTGAPLSATITIEGTPVVGHADANTGLYSLALPTGHYTATVRADAHRIGHLDLPVAVGQGQQVDVALPAAPRILLVDSGRWYYESEIRYFEDALTSLDYPFDLRTIRDPFGLSDGVGDRPSFETLAPYGIVIWSSPQDSPGLIEVDSILRKYLDGGGSLLVSGQDVGYYDGGGSPYSSPAIYYIGNLGLEFKSEGNLAALAGAPETPFAGLSVALNTPDSARQQTTPDAATITDGLLARAVLRWPQGTIGGATAGTCRPYRGVWLGFGLEGAGPRATRIEAMRRFLDWFVSPPAPYGLVSTLESSGTGNVPLIGLPGTAVSQTIQLANIGASRDTVNLLLDGGSWPVDIELPDGHHVDANTQFNVDGCSNNKIVVTVTIPPGEPRDAQSTCALRFVSQADPTAAATSIVTVKTPAPILFVDDERWYNHQDAYTRALDSLELSYDLFDTRNGDFTPSAGILQRYPLVVWTTGYDWYNPISEADEVHLSTYLDGGGGLLLTSQDALDVLGISEFVRDRLGVAAASLSITSTEVTSVPGGPLGAGLGPWKLTYPFGEWSDALAPTAQASGTLQNERLFTMGVARPAPGWRTAFFSFPLETLADAPRETLIGRTLVWLSPLGESRLEAPTVAAKGSRIPITLTLGLATHTPQSGLRAQLGLPAEADLAPGSLRGPWQYDAATRLLWWSGDLSPEQRITLGANLDLATAIPDGFILPLRVRLFAGDGITLTADAPVHLDVPWLTLQEDATPAEPRLQAIVDYSFTLTNAGVMPASGCFTDTLPVGMEPVPDSARSSSGQIAIGPRGLTWSGDLAAASAVAIGYRARVTQYPASGVLTDRAEATDQFGRRVIAAAALRPGDRSYLPLVGKGVP